MVRRGGSMLLPLAALSASVTATAVWGWTASTGSGMFFGFAVLIPFIMYRQGHRVTVPGVLIFWACAFVCFRIYQWTPFAALLFGMLCVLAALYNWGLETELHKAARQSIDEMHKKTSL